MMYVEMAIGQYFRGGSVVSWSKIHPCLKGIGTLNGIMNHVKSIIYHNNLPMVWCQ